MKTVTKIGFLAVAALGLALVTPAALAVCGNDVTFSQFTGVVGGAPCPGGSCYVVSPGANTIASLNNSIFWIVGKGNPVVGLGTDNGAYKPDGAGSGPPPKPWLTGPYPGGWQINSGWAQGETDGCGELEVDNMAVAMFDSSADGLRSFYAIGAANLNYGRIAQWDFTTGGQNMALQEIPRLTVTNASRDSVNRNLMNISVSWTNNLASAFTPNTSTATLASVLSGFSIYSREVPGAQTTAPVGREASLWTSRGAVVGSSANAATVQFACSSVSNNAFVALGLDFNSGFKSPVVGQANATRIACDPNLASPSPRPGPKAKPIDRKMPTSN